MAPMGKKLTEAQVERYRRDGFVYPIDAFTAEQAWRYRQAMEQFEASQGRQLTRGHNFKPHLLFTWVDEIVHHPAILDAVEDVIGPDIRLFHLSVWPKNAGDAAYVRSEEHTSELQSLRHLVCRLLLEKKNKNATNMKR